LLGGLPIGAGGCMKCEPAPSQTGNNEEALAATTETRGPGGKDDKGIGATSLAPPPEPSGGLRQSTAPGPPKMALPSAGGANMETGEADGWNGAPRISATAGAPPSGPPDRPNQPKEIAIDPNGRFATTYRPGGGHLAAFES